MTVLRRLLGGERRGSVEDPSEPLTSKKLLSLYAGAETEAGEEVSPESAYRMTAVYRAVALLSGLISGLPLHAYRRRDDGGRERLDIGLIRDPHPEQTPMEIFEFAAQSLLTYGNAYFIKHRNANKFVQWIEPIHPGRVSVTVDERWQRLQNPTGKRIGVHEGTGVRWYDPSEYGEIMHIPGPSKDGVTGMSPIAQARQAIGLSLASERYAAKMFSRGALPQGVLQAEGELNQEQAEALKQSWASKTAGPENQWSIPVLDSGAKYEALTLPPADAQYIEIRRFSIAEIARLYGIPPHLLADVERSTSWGSGIETQNMQMLTFTLDPWLTRIEQRIKKSGLLMGTQADYVRFSRAALLRADTETRYLAYQRGVTHGWLSQDEVRQLEDMDPQPGGNGDRYYRPANLTPVDEDDSG